MVPNEVENGKLALLPSPSYPVHTLWTQAATLKQDGSQCSQRLHGAVCTLKADTHPHLQKTLSTRQNATAQRITPQMSRSSVPHLNGVRNDDISDESFHSTAQQPSVLRLSQSVKPLIDTTCYTNCMRQTSPWQ